MANDSTLAGATVAHDAAGPGARAEADHTEDTRALLQRQLRAITRLYLALIAFGAAVRLAPLVVGRPHLMNPFQVAAAPVVAAAMLATAWYVGRGRRPSLSGLRWIDLLLIGLLTALMVFSLFREVANPDVRRYAVAFGPNGVAFRLTPFALPWVLVILLYGVYVPNPLWRAVALSGAMAAAAVASTAAGLAAHSLPLEVTGTGLFAVACLTFVAAAVAVYASQRIDTYRREAVDARRVGPYALVRKLGSGGMGEVYLAEHRLLKRPCAVKLIRPESAADPALVRRFEREVQATTRLTHPAAVQVFDYGQSEDGTFYYVMEYLPGLTLEQVVKRGGPVPPGRAVRVLRQVCAALAEAHAAGLVHRDVKPANVMLCRLGGRPDAAKLLDFGLVADAADDGGLTQVGGILGTPAYLSPEQASGEAAGPASDLYSLGAVAYFLLTGRPPFAGANALALLHAHRTETPPPPDAPPDLAGVVLRLLAKRPDERPASAAEAERALAACVCAAAWTDADADGWWDAQPAAP